MKLQNRNSLLPKSPSIQCPSLPAEFFTRKTLTVAQEVLGKGLWVQTESGPIAAEIHEVEAYLGSEDPASHSFSGKTKRNWPMFEEGGLCYVYLCYGMHFCVNIVTGQKGVGEALLIRAGMPLLGMELMQKRRGIQNVHQLLNGPGKLTQALGIDLSHNGTSLISGEVRIVDMGTPVPKSRIAISKRIGITKGADLPYRFSISGSAWLSKGG